MQSLGPVSETHSCSHGVWGKAHIPAWLAYLVPERHSPETSGGCLRSCHSHSAPRRPLGPLLAVPSALGWCLSLRDPSGRGTFALSARQEPGWACPLHLAALTPALWLCRHGCHTVIASRSLPRVSMVRGLSCAHTSLGGFGGWEPGPGGS